MGTWNKNYLKFLHMLVPRFERRFMRINFLSESADLFKLNRTKRFRGNLFEKFKLAKLLTVVVGILRW